MLNFRRANNRDVTGTIDLVQGNSLRLKLEGVVKGGKATHYQVRSASPLITISQRASETQREQVITLNVSETGTARLISISAHSSDNNSMAASFRVNILPKLRLPDFGSDEGIVAYLLLAESLTPDFKVAYGDGAEVFRAMEMMREVLDNRLSAARVSDALRSYVACNPTSEDLRGIVQANLCGRTSIPQFDGFDGPRGAPDQRPLIVINAVLSQANDGTDSLFEKSRVHVKQAIEIASRPVKAASITDSSLLFWRTTRSGSPTAYARPKHTVAGQNFFTLSSNYLKNPQNPGTP